MLRLPKRLKNAQDVLGRNFVDGFRAQRRRFLGKRSAPLMTMRRVPPGGFFCREEVVRAFSKGGDAPLQLASRFPRGDRVKPIGEIASTLGGERARLCQRNRRETTEPHLAKLAGLFIVGRAPTPIKEGPAPAQRRAIPRNGQIESAAICMAARLRQIGDCPCAQPVQLTYHRPVPTSAPTLDADCSEQKRTWTADKCPTC